VPDPALLAKPGKVLGTIGRTIIGQDGAKDEAETGKVGQGGVEKLQHRFSLLFCIGG